MVEQSSVENILELSFIQNTTKFNLVLHKKSLSFIVKLKACLNRLKKLFIGMIEVDS